jgi:hypothetical protein
MIVDVAVEDMLRLVAVAGDSPFTRLRARGASGLVLAGGMAGTGPEALVANTLLTFHTTTDLTTLTNPNEALPPTPTGRRPAHRPRRTGTPIRPAKHRAALTEAVLDQTPPRSSDRPGFPGSNGIVNLRRFGAGGRRGDAYRPPKRVGRM